MIQKVLLVLLATVSFSYGRMVVISDIDDTIKVSHVLDKTESVKNAFRTDNVFRGMPELYQLILAAYSDSDFYYISNAPKALMERSHRQFLAKNNFPDGVLLVRENLSDKNHKVNAIRTILNDSTVKAVLFIGDNAERDTLIYSQMAREFSQIPSLTFIRQAYSIRNNEDLGKSLEAGQMGFVTPIEISLELRNRRLLSENQVQALEAYFVPATVMSSQKEDNGGKTGLLSFPSWIDCRDFRIPNALSLRPTTNAKLLVNRVQNRCTPGTGRLIQLKV